MSDLSVVCAFGKSSILIRCIHVSSYIYFWCCKFYFMFARINLQGSRELCIPTRVSGVGGGGVCARFCECSISDVILPQEPPSCRHHSPRAITLVMLVASCCLFQGGSNLLNFFFLKILFLVILRVIVK